MIKINRRKSFGISIPRVRKVSLMMGPKGLKISLAALAVAGLAGCNQSGDGYLAQSNKHLQPISSAMMASLSEKGVSARAPMLIRTYKKESELEVWKQNSAGEYVLVKTFPMCRWSGQLGPKKTQGDRQVPEGFYSITPGQMNPNSAYYLSFNVGYPNAYDRAHGYDGSLIMVHGACSSMGCFSMTDQQIADIYALARESFTGGQQSIQMQSYPFRFNPENLAKYRADPNMPFWKMLKEGSDSFDVTKRETKVSICDRKYVFNKSANACAPDASSPVVQAVARKNHADEVKVAELSPSTQAVRRRYVDGDQHPSFRYRYSGDQVSQPQALDAVTEVAVADIAPKASVAVAAASPVLKSSPRPSALASVRPAATPVAAPAMAAVPQQKENPSFFRKWLNTDEPDAAPAATAAAPAAEPAKAAAPAKKADPKKQSKAKAADKTADASAIIQQQDKSMLSQFTAMVSGWK